jgi:photosystem II stability/assembly factor-like uncharacterized protein
LSGDALLSGGAPAVWRSENGGESWSRLARGLPKKQSYFTVLRDAMDIDRLKSPALYFGTTTGQLWIGREGGEQWDCLFDSLPRSTTSRSPSRELPWRREIASDNAAHQEPFLKNSGSFR